MIYVLLVLSSVHTHRSLYFKNLFLL